jgi:hypothetical protein
VGFVEKYGLGWEHNRSNFWTSKERPSSEPRPVKCNREPTMIPNRFALSRRSLFQGIGATAVASSTLLRSAEARAVGGRPCRLVVLFTPHGAPAEFFWPTSATNYASSGGTVSILSPLQKHASKINVIRGIDYVGYDNHPAIHDVITNRTGTSIDGAIAKKLGVKPLRLGVVPDYAQSFTVDGQFAFDNGTPQPHNADPARAFDALAAALPTGGAPAPGGAAPKGPADYRRLALGVTRAELEALQKRVPGKLDKHVAAIGALAGTAPGGTTKAPVVSCTTKPTLANVEAVRGKNVWAAENFPAVLSAQMDVAMFALKCGLTRVVSIQCGYVNNQIPFTWAGVSDGHHNVSHSSPGAAGRVAHAKCQEWYAMQWAKLLDALSVTDPEDATRTMLDNTIVLWCTEIGDGQAHTCQSVPMVMAGGGGGYFKTGQYLQLSARPHAEVLAAICEAMGAAGTNVGANAAGGALKEVKA